MANKGYHQLPGQAINSPLTMAYLVNHSWLAIGVPWRTGQTKEKKKKYRASVDALSSTDGKAHP
jgi:hypothetical protein